VSFYDGKGNSKEDPSRTESVNRRCVARVHVSERCASGGKGERKERRSSRALREDGPPSERGPSKEPLVSYGVYRKKKTEKGPFAHTRERSRGGPETLGNPVGAFAEGAWQKKARKRDEKIGDAEEGENHFPSLNRPLRGNDGLTKKRKTAMDGPAKKKGMII